MNRSASWYLAELIRRDLETGGDLPAWWDEALANDPAGLFAVPALPDEAAQKEDRKVS